MNISEKIRKVIKDNGLKDSEFALNTGIAIDRVRNLCQGKVKKLQPHETDAICKAYKINPEWWEDESFPQYLTASGIAKPELEKKSKDVLGEAPARYAPNQNAEFEARLKRVADMTQASMRIYSELGYIPSSEWVSLLQMLLFDQRLDEAGAKQIVELLKRQGK